MNSSHRLGQDPPESSTTSIRLPFVPPLAALALLTAGALFPYPARAADAPKISDASMKPRRFAVDHRGTPEAQVGKARGTTFSYRVSEDADVFFFLDRGVAGRTVGGHCHRQTRRNKRHHERCVLYVRSGSFRQDARQGLNIKSFSGRIGRHNLRPAHYRMRIVAVDSMGNPSPSGPTLRFTVLRG